MGKPALFTKIQIVEDVRNNKDRVSDSSICASNMHAFTAPRNTARNCFFHLSGKTVRYGAGENLQLTSKHRKAAIFQCADFLSERNGDFNQKRI
jgi:hypothetical protein